MRDDRLGVNASIRQGDGQVRLYVVGLYRAITYRVGDSVLYEASLKDPSSCVCVSRVQFSPQPLEEGGEAAAIGTVVSLYDSTIGLHCKTVNASLHEQAALLSGTFTLP